MTAPRGDRPWQEPYWLLWAFVAAPPEHREWHREMVPRACRELRKRAYYLKRNLWRSATVRETDQRDKALYGAISALVVALNDHAEIDEDSRRRILEVCGKILTYQG